jgi:hypothetical protein
MEVIEMPICPACGYEYLPGITKCPDCGASLVETLSEPEIYTDENVVVYETYNENDALIVKAYLEAEGIDAVVQGDAVENIYPSFANEISKKVVVLERDKTRAMEALQNHESFGASATNEDNNVRS